MNHTSFRRTSQVLGLAFLILWGLQTPALATIRNVKTNCGATGNGSTDDTAAISTCISQLVSGDTLLFPAGTYKTSGQLTIGVSNVTVDGSNNTATIHDTFTGNSNILVISNSGSNNPSLGPTVALGAIANELATSFTTVSSLGVGAGDYVYLHQGGMDSSQGSSATQCDTAGCRGEVLKVASVAGNTITVTTTLHDTYNPSVNAAVAQKLLNPITGVTVQNITLDGNHSVYDGFVLAGAVDATISGVTAKNVLAAAIYVHGGFNNSFSNITVTQAGSAACGAAVSVFKQGRMSISGMLLSNLNAAPSACLGNGAFGFDIFGGFADATVNNLTIDSAGTTGGRPFKTIATRYSTFNSTTVKNGCCAFNGISLEYYSSHNTFNNCVVQNNAAGNGSGGAGINSFGNFNQFNTFNNCTVTGNGNIQILINNFDALRLGQDSHVTINGTTIGGPGTGILVNASNACINNNVFTPSSGMATGISVMNSTNVGSGNVLNGYSSNLPAGICQSPGTSAGPAPPTGVAATVQ